MNVWNARTATNASKTGFLLITLLFCAAPVAAQNTAPALYNVKEMMVQQARLGNSDVTANCGLSAGEISHIVIKSMKDSDLPAFSIVGAPDADPKVARIDVLPTVASIQTDPKVCTSWISLAAQSRNIVILPPIETPRNVVVGYWDAGVMVHSSRERHAQAIINAFDKLAVSLASQYRLDQPPSLAPRGQTTP